MPQDALFSPSTQHWEELRQLADTLRHMKSPILAELGMSHVFCVQRHNLRNVRLSQPTLVLVLQGSKRHSLHTTGEHAKEVLVAQATAPCLLLLPADTPLYIENIPDSESSTYLAYCLSFAPTLLERVASHFPVLQTTPKNDATAIPFIAHVVPPDASLLILLQVLLRITLEQIQDGSVCARLLQLQCEQIALLLFLRGFGAHLLGRHNALVSEAMRLIQQQPHLPWTLENLAQELCCSSRTLRRHLQKEGRSSRELLRHARLHAALGMLQQQRCTVSEAALSCGYNSPSRFSCRFHEHFGLLPSELLRSGRKNMA